MRDISKKLGSEYYRNQLTNQGRLFYDRINSQLLREDWSGYTEVSISNRRHAASDCFAAYKAVRDDHPEYFFLGNTVDISYSSRRGRISYQIIYSGESIKRTKQKLRETIYRYVEGTAYMTQIEREITVYERIAKSIRYDSLNNEDSHNITGPVLYSCGVCEGYNSLLMLCYRRVGISCIKVEGETGEDGGHCWTIAWINGQPVHCDVTWDRANGGFISFEYFNLSDSQILKDHRITTTLAVPKCTCERWTYYSHYGKNMRSFKELLNYLKSKEASKRPILLHLDFPVKNNDYLSATNKAMKIARCMNSWNIRLSVDHKNVIITDTRSK